MELLQEAVQSSRSSMGKKNVEMPVLCVVIIGCFVIMVSLYNTM